MFTMKKSRSPKMIIINVPPDAEFSRKVASPEDVQNLINMVNESRKIVALIGAGASVAAGIPDFRSKKKGLSPADFSFNVYKQTPEKIAKHHAMITSLFRICDNVRPTTFHRFLAELASQKRLMRLYSQNIDFIEQELPQLRVDGGLPDTSTPRSNWPITVHLHGRLDRTCCPRCPSLAPFRPEDFVGSEQPLCTNCHGTTSSYGRVLGAAPLRPYVLLYNEDSRDDTTIPNIIQADISDGADLLLVAGTTLKIPGCIDMVREFCRTHVTTVWINVHEPPKNLEGLWDYIVLARLDVFAAKMEVDAIKRAASVDANTFVPRSKRGVIAAELARESYESFQ